MALNPSLTAAQAAIEGKFAVATDPQCRISLRELGELQIANGGSYTDNFGVACYNSAMHTFTPSDSLLLLTTGCIGDSITLGNFDTANCCDTITFPNDVFGCF